MNCLDTLRWGTNYNNKLCCLAFLHIDLAPEIHPVRSIVDKMLFKIETKDNSHEPVTTILYDILFFPKEKLTDMLSFASHGTTAKELTIQLEKNYSKPLVDKRGLAVYFYLKTN